MEREEGNAGRAAGGCLLGRRAAALCQAQLPVSSERRQEPAGQEQASPWPLPCASGGGGGAHTRCSLPRPPPPPSAQGTLTWEGLVCTALGSSRDPQQGLNRSGPSGQTLASQIPEGWSGTLLLFGVSLLLITDCVGVGKTAESFQASVSSSVKWAHNEH